VHERIDTASILRAAQKRMKEDGEKESPSQGDFFRAWFEELLPLFKAVEFYKHDRGLMNRLVAGDSLLVMNSLLKKEGMAGQVQMIYIDPPYGIKYGSNFQPFTNKRDWTADDQREVGHVQKVEATTNADDPFPVFDVELARGLPRHVDVLLVAMGDCAAGCGMAGGLFGENYASYGKIANVIPMDVEVPGCPPTPTPTLTALLAGILAAVPGAGGVR